ncbi:hypothetical protein [Brachybacterium paraconglomeratum]|uniref:hypothetical protein n=1 Tax=Brachybacterium paraconglomeratum TaxID=173362 RepID=UPI00026C6A1C|nr:hypothetical protein [Brachybacterium paraconglomeratum]
MNSIMRKTVRGTATGLGALALIAGASACGAIGDLTGGGEGGDDPSAEQPADEEEGGESEGGEPEGAESEGSAEDGESSEGDGASTDESEDAEGDDAGGDTSEGGDEAAGPISEEELTTAGDRFYAFFEAIGAQDPEGACRLVIDYDTGEPAESDGLQTCVDSFDEEFGGDFDPSAVDAIERSMIGAEDNGDGRASITMLDEPADMYMKKADDGQWYIEADAPF